MAHTHDVYDMENHFEINGSSRFIKETSETKLVVVQGDHKSEVLTFKMPRYIDGHDMTLCNKIRIHYINLDTKTNNKSADVYEVTDLTLCEECEDVLTFTWVIEAQATKYSGTLSFLVKFECTEGENVLYQWNTAKYVSVNVLAGIDNSEEFVDKYSNVLEEWYNELTKGADSIEELNQQALAEIELAKEDAKEDIQGKANSTMAGMEQFSTNAYNNFKNDVDEKAARTLEMIPDEYSELDAEVKDIRVCADGVTYASAGVAVRRQINELTQTLEKMERSTIKSINDFAPDENGNVEIEVSGGGITEDVKIALINCFKNVVWVNDDGQTLVAILEKAIKDSAIPEKVVTSITVTYTGDSTVKVGRATNTLAITVMANYEDGTNKKILGYEVTPETVVEGNNTITVTYKGLNKTFDVIGEEIPVVLERVEATYNGGEVPQGTDVSELDVIVTAYYNDGTTENVDNFTLSGTIGVGANTITVTYEEKTTTITVVGYKVINYVFKDGEGKGDGRFTVQITNHNHFKLVNNTSNDLQLTRVTLAILDEYYNQGKTTLFTVEPSSHIHFEISNASYTGNTAPKMQFYLYDNSGDSVVGQSFTDYFVGSDILIKNVEVNGSYKQNTVANITNVGFYCDIIPANSTIEFDFALYVDDEYIQER